jgi:ABC-2 type transport system permease protein
VVHTAFPLADTLSTGFDRMAALLRSGEFDRFLLRPRSLVLQIAGHDFQLRRAGRLLQGVLVLCWACATADIAWTAGHGLLLLFAIAGGVCLFCGLLVVQATISFWTIESLEVMNTLTYGGCETAQYPLAIYTPWFRRFFIYVVPLACVVYFPVVALLGIRDPLGTSRGFQSVAPLAGPVFLLLSLLLFRVGVRHYTSTGS